jgi:methionyl-tRNA formyltransferase
MPANSAKKKAILIGKIRPLDITRAIRAFNAWPVAYTQVQGQIVRIWQAHIVVGEKTTAPAGMIIKADKQGLWVAAGVMAYWRLIIYNCPMAKPYVM